MGLDTNTYTPPHPETRPSPGLALTLGEMHDRGWALRAVCTRCQTYLWVDYPPLLATIGPDTFFWGRRGQCRVMVGISRCHGRTRYEVRPARAGAWASLDDNLTTARHLLKVRQAKAMMR